MLLVPCIFTHVPIGLWGECVLTATFLVNRVPSLWTQNKSLFELLYKKPMDYSSFRVFGCLAFASTLASHRDKFMPRARACVFLGYPPCMKWYKLFIHSKEVFVYRDVIFHESLFPFMASSRSTLVIDPFPDLVLPKPVTTDSYDHPESLLPPGTNEVPSFPCFTKFTSTCSPSHFFQNFA